MEILDLLPHGPVSITLAVLAALRVLITIVDKTVAETPDKHDDAGWTKIRSSFYMIFMEQLLYYAAGIKLPDRDKK